MLHTQAQVAIRRGHNPAAAALRELFQELVAMSSRCAASGPWPARTCATRSRTARHRADRDLRTGSPSSHRAGETSVAELMHSARPVFLDLADRSDLRETAHDWRDHLDIHTAEADDRPADALLIRPDAQSRG